MPPRPLVLFLTSLLCLLSFIPPAVAGPDTSRPAPQLFVFVSASMPKGSFRTIAQDGVRYHAPLILRGLIGESLQETLLNLKEIAALGAIIQIDPLLYETYGVEMVPAVVRTCGGRGEGPFAIIYGLTVTQALPHLKKALGC